MARPQVADGGDGLRIWRVAANILNKQSRTADRGWPSRLGFREGLTNHTVSLLIFYEIRMTALIKAVCRECGDESSGPGTKALVSY
jgi:hypothetical protein